MEVITRAQTPASCASARLLTVCTRAHRTHWRTWSSIIPTSCAWQSRHATDDSNVHHLYPPVRRLQLLAYVLVH
eukprot:6188610-Pleurochrysis_carterae.AAC.1